MPKPSHPNPDVQPSTPRGPNDPGARQPEVPAQRPQELPPLEETQEEEEEEQ